MPSHWTSSNNALTLDFQDNQHGNATITVTATDASNASATQTFTVTVTSVNDPPTVAASIQDVTVSEDAANMTINLTDKFSDLDGDSLTMTASSADASLVTASVSNNALTLVFQDNQHGNTTITVTATDTSNATATQTFTVTVTPVNDSPTVAASIQDVTVSEDAANMTIDLTDKFSDLDGDSLTMTASSADASLVTASVSNNALTLDFQDNQHGNATITVTATDASNASATQTFTVTVTSVNDPPTVAASIQDVTVSEDAANMTINLTDKFSDLDGDSLTMTASSADASLVTASVSNNALTLDFQDNQHGNATITVTATDASNASATQTFTVTVTSVNDPPTVAASIQDVTVSEDAANMTINLTDKFSDLDGDSLTMTASSADASLVTASVSNNALTLVFQDNQHGNTTITVTATDTSNATATQTFTVTVTPVNDSPTVAASIQDVTVSEDAANMTIDLTDKFSDLDGDSLTMTASSADASLVTASVSNNALTLDFQDNQHGNAPPSPSQPLTQAMQPLRRHSPSQ